MPKGREPPKKGRFLDGSKLFAEKQKNAKKSRNLTAQAENARRTGIIKGKGILDSNTFAGIKEKLVEAIRLDSRNATAYKLLAEEERNAGHFQEALQIVRSAIHAGVTDFETRLYYGQLLFEGGYNEKAITVFNALKQETSDPNEQAEILGFLAETYNAMGGKQRAIAFLQEAANLPISQEMGKRVRSFMNQLK